MEFLLGWNIKFTATMLTVIIMHYTYPWSHGNKMQSVAKAVLSWTTRTVLIPNTLVLCRWASKIVVSSWILTGNGGVVEGGLKGRK